MRRHLLEGIIRSPLTEAAPLPDPVALAELAAGGDHAAKRRLGRSLSIREIDAGSCNGCELEIHALGNAFYDLERFGFCFFAPPPPPPVLFLGGPAQRKRRGAR